MNERTLFYKHLAQTSPAPLALEIEKAEGDLMYTKEGRVLIDLIGGINVAHIGHRHPRVLRAIQDQLEKYLHVMVYGELIQSPQVQYASLLAKHLPSSLHQVYFTNSGSEAVEGAMKLAKRATGRHKMIAFNKSYHGSTQGALSMMGDEYWRNQFRPLLPAIQHLDYNNWQELEAINDEVACVLVETVQAESGIEVPDKKWMQALRQRCSDKGVLLIMDEIQCGFYRTGKLWAFEHFDIIPDVLLLGKALGGGMPLGAFITDQKRMKLLSHDPVLGHISTFGGHPVSCAAGRAAFEVLLEEYQAAQIEKNIEMVLAIFQPSTSIKRIHHCGLWFSIQLHSSQEAMDMVNACMAEGVFVDWFLFASDCLRIAPPLNMREQVLQKACLKIKQLLDRT